MLVVVVAQVKGDEKGALAVNRAKHNPQPPQKNPLTKFTGGALRTTYSMLGGGGRDSPAKCQHPLPSSSVSQI